MEGREEEIDFSLPEDFDDSDDDKTQVKRFSDCDCKEPIVEPISYVLPDSQFISLLLCKACNGLERYSITELPNENDDPVEEVETVSSLLNDIDSLARENKRLHQKLQRQSMRMRISQNNQLPNKEQAVVSPEESEGGSAVADDQNEDQGISLTFTSSSISKTTRKVLVASLVLGVGVIGATLWRVTTLSSAAVVLGILLIIIPIFFLTDGEIPQNQKDT